MFDRRKNYVVTDVNVTGHYFDPGTIVRLKGVDRVGSRFMFRGPRRETGEKIYQWLAAEEVRDTR